MRSVTGYGLENADETRRLERQSQTPAYDFTQELEGLLAKPEIQGVQRVLDAGCGSGAVSRYLSAQLPQARVHACDGSALRVQQAKSLQGDTSDVRFEVQELTGLRYPDAHFDLVIARYVVQHLNPQARTKTFAEFHRILKPGGTLHVIDMDGAFLNFWPAPRRLQKQVQIWKQDPSTDMYVGRKLPSLFIKSGFSQVSWRIDTLDFQGALLKTEISLTRERFRHALPLLVKIMGSEAGAERFVSDYLEAIAKPGTTLFYNKFLVTGHKRARPQTPLRLVRRRPSR